VDVSPEFRRQPCRVRSGSGGRSPVDRLASDPVSDPVVDGCGQFFGVHGLVPSPVWACPNTQPPANPGSGVGRAILGHWPFRRARAGPLARASHHPPQRTPRSRARRTFGRHAAILNGSRSGGRSEDAIVRGILSGPNRHLRHDQDPAPRGRRHAASVPRTASKGSATQERFPLDARRSTGNHGLRAAPPIAGG
jgi:hypothetical protein